MRFLRLALLLTLTGAAFAGTPKESDFPEEFTVVDSGAYPNHVCWLLLQSGNELYRVRDTGYLHTACLAVGEQLHGKVKGPTKSVPQRSWLGRMGSDIRVKLLHDDANGKSRVSTYLVENITEAQSPSPEVSAQN
jgi:hypothetical protein